MTQSLGPDEVAKLQAIERLVASLQDDMGQAPESFGARMADRVAGAVGSWKFLLGQGFLLLCYMALNVWLLSKAELIAFDPYPFILLNLCLSFQAAFTAPIILMAQKRADAKENRKAGKAYRAIADIKTLVKMLADLEGVESDGQSNASI